MDRDERWWLRPAGDELVIWSDEKLRAGRDRTEDGHAVILGPPGPLTARRLRRILAAFARFQPTLEVQDCPPGRFAHDRAGV